MPHIAVTMFPGRNNDVKSEFAKKLQNFIAEELKIDKKVISVSIEDIAVENWVESMKKIDSNTMFIAPSKL